MVKAAIAHMTIQKMRIDSTYADIKGSRIGLDESSFRTVLTRDTASRAPSSANAARAGMVKFVLEGVLEYSCGDDYAQHLTERPEKGDKTGSDRHVGRS